MRRFIPLTALGLFGCAIPEIEMDCVTDTLTIGEPVEWEATVLAPGSWEVTRVEFEWQEFSSGTGTQLESVVLFDTDPDGEGVEVLSIDNASDGDTVSAWSIPVVEGFGRIVAIVEADRRASESGQTNDDTCQVEVLDPDQG